MHAIVAAACSLGFADSAEAFPSCPTLHTATPWNTPVTVTVACTDPVHSIVRYEAGANSANGDILSVSGNQVTYTPAPEPRAAEERAFTYWAINDFGEAGPGTVYVQVGAGPPLPPPPNDPPVARCDVYSAKPGEKLVVPRQEGLLRNDSDPDGDRIEAMRWYISSSDTYPHPEIKANGALRFFAPNRPRIYSFPYEIFDTHGARAQSTVTIGVGRKMDGCRAATRPPDYGDPTYKATMRVDGRVRARGGGRWRTLRGNVKLTQPLLLDTSAGSVRVRVVIQDNYNRQVFTGRFAGGVFKLGTQVQVVPGQPRPPANFGSVVLAGDTRCSGGAGPGRRLMVAATSGFFIDALRIRVNILTRRNKPKVSRFTIADNCNDTSSVVARSGWIYARNKNTGKTRIMGKGTFVARARG